MENSPHSFPLPTNPVKIASREAVVVRVVRGIGGSYEDCRGLETTIISRVQSVTLDIERSGCDRDVRVNSISRGDLIRTRRGKLGSLIEILSCEHRSKTLTSSKAEI